MFYELKRPPPDSPDYEATEPRLGDDDECAGFEVRFPFLPFALHSSDLIPFRCLPDTFGVKSAKHAYSS
jgi:hypothetical protein